MILAILNRKREINRLALALALLAILVFSGGFDMRVLADPVCNLGCAGEKYTQHFVSVPNGTRVFVAYSDWCYNMFYDTYTLARVRGASREITATAYPQGTAVCAPDGSNNDNYAASNAFYYPLLSVGVLTYEGCQN